jgi:adenylate kinase
VSGRTHSSVPRAKRACFFTGFSEIPKVPTARRTSICLPARPPVIPITAHPPATRYTRRMTAYNNRVAWLRGPLAQCDPAPQAIQAPWRLVLFGAPGVGKGTQADLLTQRLGACHLSSGDLFRAAAQGPGCHQSLAMEEALPYMRRGDLVPDWNVWAMVSERKGCLHCAGGFIFDGFPRTLAQAELLRRLLGAKGLSLTAVVNYELPAEEIVARLTGRRTCATCKAVYRLTERPPGIEGRCDKRRWRVVSTRRRPPPVDQSPAGSLRSQHCVPNRFLRQIGFAPAGRRDGHSRRDLQPHHPGARVATPEPIRRTGPGSRREPPYRLKPVEGRTHSFVCGKYTRLPSTDSQPILNRFSTDSP